MGLVEIYCKACCSGTMDASKELGPYEELLLAGISLIIGLFFVILFVACGWYTVWSLFLSRFKFVRELLGSSQEPSPSVKELSAARSRTTRKVRRD